MQVNFVKAVEGKFGPQLQDDKNNYYSFSKFYKGPKGFQGGLAEVELYVTEKGNKYINELTPVVSNGNPVVEQTPKAPVKRGRPAKVPLSVPAVETVKPVINGRDFDREAFGKIKSLFLQAVMPQLINGVMQDDELKVVIRKWALYAMEDDR